MTLLSQPAGNQSKRRLNTSIPHAWDLVLWYAASYLGATSTKVPWRNLTLRACWSQLPLAARLSSAAIVHVRCRCR